MLLALWNSRSAGLLALTLGAVALVACTETADKDDPLFDLDADADTDADGDVDTDADSDADSDVDTDTDTDTDVPGELSCSASYPTPAPGGGGDGSCVTERLNCGDVVYGKNSGGSSIFGTEVGEQFAQCSGTAGGDDFAGPERVYVISTSASMTSITAQLDSCADSWMFYFYDTDACPTGLISSCGYAQGSFTSQYLNLLPNGNSQIVLVIEGDANDGGNYRLAITCD